MKILIFSGTTEGREISYRLQSLGHKVTVSVATKFGRAVQESGQPAGGGQAALGERQRPAGGDQAASQAALGERQRPAGGGQAAGQAALGESRVQVLEGRMDETEMARVIPGFDLCIDATHPYATGAGENIRKAAKEAGVRLLRLEREKSPVPDGTVVCESAGQAAEFLKNTEGNILLTCGVKSLPAFKGIPANRLIVRIIPSEESLRLTLAAGISPAGIIAMEGPFSREFNELLIREKGVRYLVTKDGGKAGGFPQKADACRNCGAILVLIRRPEGREGYTMDRILEMLGKEA